MGVYIRGMEMPTRCFDCPMCEISDIEICCSISIGVAVSYEEIDEQIAIQDRPSWCPLVEIPPHGRLIDADAPIPLVDTHGKNIEVTVAHIIENNLGIVNAIIESEAFR